MNILIAAVDSRRRELTALSRADLESAFFSSARKNGYMNVGFERNYSKDTLIDEILRLEGW